MLARHSPPTAPTLTATAVKPIMPASLNRRDWLRATGFAAAGLALAGRTAPSLFAQHEADRSAARTTPIRISGNENPFGPSQMAIMAVLQEAERMCRYPREETTRLVELLASQNGVSPEQITLGAGSSEVLDNYAAWLTRMAGPGEVVSELPGYIKFTGMMQQLGSKIVHVPLADGMVHDIDAMAAKIGPATRCVYICNPNNPTSTIVPGAKLRAVVAEMSKKVPVFVDEAYLECSDDFEGNTCAPLVAAGHNVVVARTFSKIYGMAGMRVGYAIMPAGVAKEVAGLSVSRLGLLSTVAAIASLEDTPYVADTRAKIKAGRDSLCAVLKELGRSYAEPQGNFVFCHTGMPVKLFQEKMAAENILVGRAFPPALDHCRISIGQPDEMELCHTALRKVFG